MATRHEVQNVNKESVFVNNKTQNVYVVLYDLAENATNAQDGQKMVVYSDKYGAIYCRERSEFLEKFTPFRNRPQGGHEQ